MLVIQPWLEIPSTPRHDPLTWKWKIHFVNNKKMYLWLYGWTLPSCPLLPLPRICWPGPCLDSHHLHLPFSLLLLLIIIVPFFSFLCYDSLVFPFTNLLQPILHVTSQILHKYLSNAASQFNVNCFIVLSYCLYVLKSAFLTSHSQVKHFLIVWRLPEEY